MKKDIRDCFYCSRTPIGVDCDKVNHDCSKCKYHKCKYCEYCNDCDQKNKCKINNNSNI